MRCSDQQGERQLRGRAVTRSEGAARTQSGVRAPWTEACLKDRLGPSSCFRPDKSRSSQLVEQRSSGD